MSVSVSVIYHKSLAVSVKRWSVEVIDGEHINDVGETCLASFCGASCHDSPLPRVATVT